MNIALSLFLIIGPVAIIYCGVKALKHTIIIRKTKKRNAIPTALVASLINSNGPDRRYGLRE